MKLGFHFTQTMSGAYHFLDTPTDERAIRFTITARAESLPRFLRDKIVEVEGEIDAEGLATKKPVRGVLLLKLLEDRRLRYDLSFVADDGRSFLLRGEQDILIISVLDSMTTLPASLYDPAGEELARALLRFDVRSDLKALVRSFRVNASLA